MKASTLEEDEEEEGDEEEEEEEDGDEDLNPSPITHLLLIYPPKILA